MDEKLTPSPHIVKFVDTLKRVVGQRDELVKALSVADGQVNNLKLMIREVNCAYLDLSEAYRALDSALLDARDDVVRYNDLFDVLRDFFATNPHYKASFRRLNERLVAQDGRTLGNNAGLVGAIIKMAGDEAKERAELSAVVLQAEFDQKYLNQAVIELDAPSILAAELVRRYKV